jgi:PAS domain S-box-containing protein
MDQADAAALAQLAEDSPAKLWRGDTTGRCVYLNRSLRAFWGLTPDQCGVFDWSSRLLPEDHGAVFGPFSVGMEQQKAFTCEGRYRRADGAVRVLRTRAEPYRDAEGRFLGMVGVNEDITDLRRAEGDLVTRNGELDASLTRLNAIAERFALATHISGLAMSEHDADLRYTWSHNITADHLGMTPSEVVGPDLGPAIETILKQALASGQPQVEELSFLVGEQRMWCDIQAAPSVLPDGRAGVVASALDVTARKLNEQKLEVLARELNHRVKNVFSVVQAIVRQSARSTGMSGEFVSAVEDRISALAGAQDMLLAMSDDRFALDGMLRRQLSHLQNIELEGPPVLVPGRLGPYLALAVHELGTNAVKYGSLSVPDGSVRVAWSQPAADILRLTWREIGGPTPSKTGRAGFGSTLLTKVFSGAAGGTAELNWSPQGMEWVAEFPVALDLKLAPEETALRA